MPKAGDCQPGMHPAVDAIPKRGVAKATCAHWPLPAEQRTDIKANSMPPAWIGRAAGPPLGGRQLHGVCPRPGQKVNTKWHDNTGVFA